MSAANRVLVGHGCGVPYVTSTRAPSSVLMLPTRYLFSGSLVLVLTRFGLSVPAILVDGSVVLPAPYSPVFSMSVSQSDGEEVSPVAGKLYFSVYVVTGSYEPPFSAGFQMSVWTRLTAFVDQNVGFVWSAAHVAVSHIRSSGTSGNVLCVLLDVGAVVQLSSAIVAQRLVTATRTRAYAVAFSLP